MNKNHSVDQMQVNSSVQCPVTTPESPSLIPITYSELTVSLDGAKPGKEDPSPPCREGRGIGWLSAKPPQLHAPPYSWNGWRTADWVGEGSPYSKQLRVHPIGAFLVCANEHHQATHMPTMDKFQKAAMLQTPMVEPPLLNMASSMVPESRKHASEQTANI